MRSKSYRWSPGPELVGTRGRIFEYVRAHPGIHVRRIGKELSLAPGDIQYHLDILQRQGMIKMRRSGLHRFVFPSNIFGEMQETILSLLSLETPREILLCLMQHPNLTQKELAGLLKYSAPTVWWHIDRLLRLGVIGRTRRGKSVTYEVLAGRDDILRFVRYYHPSVWEKWAGRLSEIVMMLDSEQESRDGP